MNKVIAYLTKEAGGMSDCAARGIDEPKRTAKLLFDALSTDCRDEKLAADAAAVLETITGLADDPGIGDLRKLLLKGLKLLDPYARFVLMQTGHGECSGDYMQALTSLGISNEDEKTSMAGRRAAAETGGLETCSNGRIYAMVDDMLLDYLVITQTAHMELEQLCTAAREASYFPDTYVREIIRDYNKEAENGFKYIDFHWEGKKAGNIEKRVSDLLGDPQQFDDDEENKYIKLLGEAGIGKSTAMKRIEFIMAENYRNGTDTRIPVYVQLGDLTDKEDLLGSINKKTRLSKADIKELLNEGKLFLLLDGYNEILDKNLQRTIASYIDRTICNFYPDTRIILSDRTISRNSIPVLTDATVLHLKTISMEDKMTFFRAFLSDEEFDLIVKKAESNPRYFNKIDTPYKMMLLATIVKKRGGLPSSEELTPLYLESLMERERNEKKEKEMIDVEDYLQAVAIWFHDNDVKEGMTVIDMQMLLKRIGDALGLNSAPKKILDLTLGMKILVREVEDDVSFYSKEFQDYFWAEGMFRGMDSVFKQGIFVRR